MNYTIATGPRTAATELLVVSGNSDGFCCGFGTRQNSDLRAAVPAAGFTLNEPGDNVPIPDVIPPTVKVVWLWLPNGNFTTNQVNGLKSFAAEGGRILMTGENDAFLVANGALTTLLGQLGSGMSINSGVQLVSNTLTDITAAQLTTGVTQVEIATASSIDLGSSDTSLVRDDAGNTAIGVTTVDTTPI